MYLKNLGMDREDLLENLVYQYVFAKSNHSNTLLGEAQEITRAKSLLDGVCMALALEYQILNKEIVFKTVHSKKLVLKMIFAPDKPL